MKASTIAITVYSTNHRSDLPADDAALLAQADDAAYSAYAPYSHFQVGAAVLLDNGAVVCGSNQENTAYPSGLCAERVALFYAASHHPGIPIRAIAISATVDGKEHDIPVSPCGNCRQVLLEYEHRFGKPIRVIMGSTTTIQAVATASDLLPLSFTIEEK